MGQSAERPRKRCQSDTDRLGRRGEGEGWATLEGRRQCGLLTKAATPALLLRRPPPLPVEAEGFHCQGRRINIVLLSAAASAELASPCLSARLRELLLPSRPARFLRRVHGHRLELVSSLSRSRRLAPLRIIISLVVARGGRRKDVIFTRWLHYVVCYTIRAGDVSGRARGGHEVKFDVLDNRFSKTQQCPQLRNKRLYMLIFFFSC